MFFCQSRLIKNLPVVTFLQKCYNIASCTFPGIDKVKWPVSGAKKHVQFSPKPRIVTVLAFYYIGSCTYNGNSEIKCLASGAEILMLYGV